MTASTADKKLADTNVLVYCYDESDVTKHNKAKALVQGLMSADQLVLSAQVLNEFYAVVTRPTRAASMSVPRAARIVNEFCRILRDPAADAIDDTPCTDGSSETHAVVLGCIDLGRSQATWHHHNLFGRFPTWPRDRWRSLREPLGCSLTGGWSSSCYDQKRCSAFEGCILTPSLPVR